MYSVPAVLEPP